MKPSFCCFAIFQNVFRRAIGHAVTILHAYDGNDRLRMLNLPHIHFG